MLSLLKVSAILGVSVALSVGGELVSLPSGTFVMGTANGPVDSRPVHSVTLRAFSIDRHEVTFAEYDSCVKRGACTPAHYDDGKCLMMSPPAFTRVTVPERYRSPQRPVVCVTWAQARTYCRWKGRRLPTEAEWEYAALAGRDTPYSWGSESPSQARCTPVSNMSPKAVGSYSPNAWGLYDMTGNVWEWTNDWYQRDYYQFSEPTNPAGASVGQYRIIRGGGWYGGAEHLRIRNRAWFQPTSAEVSIGFRCAR